MIKNECKIVRDLFPNYIENEVSNETKEFIDGHLKSCKECSEILKDINKSNIKHESDEEKDEIDFLKKYNEKIKIAKTTIIILLIIIVSSFGTIVGTYTIKYSIGKKAHDIIDEVYNKTEEFKKLNNLILEIDSEGCKTTYSYKDGYLKEENNYKIDKTKEEQENFKFYGTMSYGRVGNFENTYFEVDKYIGVSWGYDINHKPVEGSISTTFRQNITVTNEFNVIDTIYNKDIMECTNIKVIEDEEWYILKEYSAESGVNELYISKNDMLLKKYVRNNTYTKVYKYTIGTLKDEDVRLTDIEKYQDKDKMKYRGYSGVWNVYLSE